MSAPPPLHGAPGDRLAVSPPVEEPEPSPRPDLSRLSEEQLRSLEALYVDKRQDTAEENGEGGEAG